MKLRTTGCAYIRNVQGVLVSTGRSVVSVMSRMVSVGMVWCLNVVTVFVKSMQKNTLQPSA